MLTPRRANMLARRQDQCIPQTIAKVHISGTCSLLQSADRIDLLKNPVFIQLFNRSSASAHWKPNAPVLINSNRFSTCWCRGPPCKMGWTGATVGPTSNSHQRGTAVPEQGDHQHALPMAGRRRTGAANGSPPGSTADPASTTPFRLACWACDSRRSGGADVSAELGSRSGARLAQRARHDAGRVGHRVETSLPGLAVGVDATVRAGCLAVGNITDGICIASFGSRPPAKSGPAGSRSGTCSAYGQSVRRRSGCRGENPSMVARPTPVSATWQVDGRWTLSSSATALGWPADLGVSDALIGLTVVAIGTSAP